MFVESYCANSISSKLYWIIYSHVTTDLIFSNMCCNRIEYSRQIFGILFLIDFGFDVLGIIVQIIRDTIRILYSQLNFLPMQAYILFNESLQILFGCESDFLTDLIKISFGGKFRILSGVYYNSTNDLVKIC